MRKQNYCKKDCVFGRDKDKNFILMLQCVKCENKDKWQDLDTAKQCLIKLYDLALKKGNLELAQSTYKSMLDGGFADIIEP